MGPGREDVFRTPKGKFEKGQGEKKLGATMQVRPSRESVSKNGVDDGEKR